MWKSPDVKRHRKRLQFWCWHRIHHSSTRYRWCYSVHHLCWLKLRQRHCRYSAVCRTIFCLFICSLCTEQINVHWLTWLCSTTFTLFFFSLELINFTQALYVWREDPNSRQNTIKTVIQRANSHEKWPQIIIFPEGTCTNRSCVLSFKPGSFYPGVPVQPVLIRYPNRFDTVTWTWEGPGA